MRYSEIVGMCRPEGGLRGCPWDGLGCTGGQKCSINRGGSDFQRAWNANKYGSDFVCAKRERAGEILDRERAAEQGEK